MQYLQILRGHLTDAVSFISHLDNMYFLLSNIASSFQQNVWRYLHCSKAVTGKVLCSDSDTEPSCSFSMLKYVVFVLKCLSRGHMYLLSTWSSWAAVSAPAPGVWAALAVFCCQTWVRDTPPPAQNQPVTGEYLFVFIYYFCYKLIYIW